MTTTGAGADVAVIGTGTTVFVGFGGVTTGGFTSLVVAGAATGGGTAASLVLGVFVVALAGLSVLVSWAKAVAIPATRMMVQMEIQAFIEGNFPDLRQKVTGGF